MVRVGVIGATGYAGAELVRILSGHPEKVYPSFTGVVTKPCDPLSVEDMCEKADLIFLALPHKIPMSIVPELMAQKKRVVDLSADFRFRNVDAYEKHYQTHTAKEYIPGAVYGLSEVYEERIRSADLIGNPGCYPTSILLPLIPLMSSDHS